MHTLHTVIVNFLLVYRNTDIVYAYACEEFRLLAEWWNEYEYEYVRTVYSWHLPQLQFIYFFSNKFFQQKKIKRSSVFSVWGSKNWNHRKANMKNTLCVRWWIEKRWVLALWTMFVCMYRWWQSRHTYYVCVCVCNALSSSVSFRRAVE